MPYRFEQFTMPSCVSHTVNTYGELHDWFSGALAFTLLGTVGVGALLAGWQVTRRDYSLRAAVTLLVASLAVGCAATWLGTLMVATSETCGGYDRSSSSWVSSGIEISRAGFPAYVVESWREPDSPRESERHSALAVANILFFSGLSYAAMAYARSRITFGRRSRSPRARAS